ncbi:MAG TPA: hypothetical protein VK988_06365, partial [Acidimicrobiales bacterium]|nr:hypothetical protein [Acidimicrobiales bacterium]
GPAGAAFETGVNEGGGAVTITFDPAAGGCPAPAPAPSPNVVSDFSEVAPGAIVRQPNFVG